MNRKSVFEQLVQFPYLQPYIRLITSSLKLDIYSKLTVKKTSAELAVQEGWNHENTEYMLCALTSLGFLKKEGDLFVNSEETSRYLVKGNPDYMGGSLPYITSYDGEREMPVGLDILVRKGPQSMVRMQDGLATDFEQMAEIIRQAQMGYRQQEVLRIIRGLPENDRIRSVLDLGCATGMIGLDIISDRDDREGILFDQMPAEVMQSSINLMKLGSRVKARTGNFMTDDIGSGYDLILCIHIMDYAQKNLEGLFKKLYDALNQRGVIVIISEGIESDFTNPWGMVVGYLQPIMQGLGRGIRKGEIGETARNVGFTDIQIRTQLFCSGTQDLLILRK